MSTSVSFPDDNLDPKNLSTGVPSESTSQDESNQTAPNPFDLKQLSGADLRGANLRGANLRGADLRGADLRGADLSEADLRGADLSEANLRGADLRWANLSVAHLRGADLSEADLRGANLSGANLSGAEGLVAASSFLGELEADDYGVIAYKNIGNTYFSIPGDWKIAPNEFLTENVERSPTVDCGCGVNVATKEWGLKSLGDQLWRVRIHWIDLADVVVPYNTEGKFRARRVELLERIK